ncbi:uncharacterized protein BX663DRAFT_490599 [Cokeromyces recurvatus]|uniref:uncharacterized protein n=1 Tax=Cokeromyces recurvatus TaxID=90255 RepID=UPI00221F7102|nr:uncharacterized protein BX663DRAFT_490599 [Cokeromyces recurvatus]KAI7897771.1 hypothetical protein BX663DRAFT_490599 [Cokeromyces recurvatus]
MSDNINMDGQMKKQNNVSSKLRQLLQKCEGRIFQKMNQRTLNTYLLEKGAIKVRLSKSTAARKFKEWNEMKNDSDQGGTPDTISPKEYKGRRLILKDVLWFTVYPQFDL